MIKGQVISGEFGNILIRQKSDEKIELGELMIADTTDGKILLQVFDLLYGSQISQQNLELLSGLKLEEDSSLEFMDPKLRNYNLIAAKNLISIADDKAAVCKSLPSFFSEVREITSDDLKFLTKPKNPLYMGKLRSGSKTMDVDICLDGEKVFTHHILIPATTGKGKSNMLSVMLWDTLDKDYCGLLVLDPHDEYYGRNKLGLKDHPSKKAVYYTPNNPPAGTKTLKINLTTIRPGHFNGVVNFSDPQRQALNQYYKEYGQHWVESIVAEKPLAVDFHEGTIAVIRRRILSLLDLEWKNEKLYCDGIFDVIAGESTIFDICSELESSKTVIIDTSNF